MKRLESELPIPKLFLGRLDLLEEVGEYNIHLLQLVTRGLTVYTNNGSVRVKQKENPNSHRYERDMTGREKLKYRGQSVK